MFGTALFVGAGAWWVPGMPVAFRAGLGLAIVALGIAGALLATFIGQAVGWYRPDQGAGFIAATVGAVLVLFIWNRFMASRGGV